MYFYQINSLMAHQVSLVTQELSLKMAAYNSTTLSLRKLGLRTPQWITDSLTSDILTTYQEE